MTLGGASRRRKGHDWEREVAALFRSVGYPEARRGWQARSGTDDPDIVGVPGYWIECRCRDYINIPAALRKALTDRKATDASKRGWIAVVAKRTHRISKNDPVPGKFVAMLLPEARDFVDATVKAMRPVSFFTRSSEGMEYAVFDLHEWLAGVAALLRQGGSCATGQ